MNDSLHRSVASGNGFSQAINQDITEADVRVTAVLASRPTRQPDLAADIQALQLLAQGLMDDPQAMLKTLVGLVLHRTQAGTAGVSLLETAPNGESVFRWVAIAGGFADLEHTTIPGDFSPCGTTLRTNQPQLYAHPERYFPYLQHPQLPIVEELLIPLQVNRQPLGMLWIVSHDEARRFDSEDQRLMMSLGGFTASALQSIQQLRRKAEDAQREQARAAAALRESQELNQQILDSSDDCIKVLDLEGRILFMSPGGQAFLGIRDITPFLNTSWADFWKGADQQAAIRAIAGARVGEVCTFQGYRPTLSGEPKWWDSKISPIRGAEGQVERLLCISRDITERRRSEDKRKQAEAEREQLLANERHHANQLQGLTTAALAVNSALSVEEVLQIITNQAASIIGAHQSVTSLTTDQNWAQAINAVHLSEKYAQWRGYDEPTDGSGIYACVCHLNRPVRMTQTELEAHPHWKGFGKEVDKHPPMRGWLAAPLLGRNGQNIGLIQLSDKYEGEFIQADESILVQLAQMASVAIENARLYEAEQQARASAEASREEAQAANRVKDEFLAVLSHELRSPLNPILGWSTLLLSNKLDHAKTTQALATIQRNAKLQSELIEDLLDVSRILQGKLNLNVAPVHLASTIGAAMETVRLAADAKSIQLEASLEPDVGLVAGDSTRLQQVIWNLLSNAVKFTPQGGQVGIRLERLDSSALITVSDTGQGIAPDFLPYVFDYFRQEDGATTRRFGGLGLGLAIVRHLVELHGGTVKVESPGEGQGATFTVRLPLMPTSSRANQNKRSSEPSFDLNGLKILVVDDDADAREFVAFLLEQEGAQVRAVSSAYEALVGLTESKPDVLLSDIGMPDMDGYMLMEQVRTLAPEHGGQIPAIALTAYAGEMNQQQALSAGFQKHISKPIEPERLIQVISSLIGVA